MRHHIRLDDIEMYKQRIQARSVLMQEAKRFDGIDKSWKKIMQDTAKNPNVLEACSVDGRLDTLRMLSEQLETCQKSLSEYLDTKRCAFPRCAIHANSLSALMTCMAMCLHRVNNHAYRCITGVRCTAQAALAVYCLRLIAI